MCVCVYVGTISEPHLHCSARVSLHCISQCFHHCGLVSDEIAAKVEAGAALVLAEQHGHVHDVVADECLQTPESVLCAWGAAAVSLDPRLCKARD